MNIAFSYIGTAIYIESLTKSRTDIYLKYSWAGKKLNIVSHDLEKYYCTYNGVGGRTHKSKFYEEDINGKIDKPVDGRKQSTVITMDFELEGNHKMEPGSPIYFKKTNEFIGMVIINGRKTDEQYTS